MTSSEVKILLIETSGINSGVALSIDGEIVCEYTVSSRNLHDKLLGDLINRIFLDFELNADDLNAVAISSGPGSFTGLRTGVSLSKGLCFNDFPKLISIPTLTAIANETFRIFPDKYSKIAVVTHSYKDIYYYQEFSKDLSVQSEILVLPEKDIVLKSNMVEFITFSKCRNIIPDIENSYIISVTPSIINHLAYKYFSEERFVLSTDFTPLYVQEFTPKTNILEFK